MSDIWIPCALIIIRLNFRILKNSESVSSVSKFKVKNFRILIEKKKLLLLWITYIYFFDEGGAGGRDFDGYRR